MKFKKALLKITIVGSIFFISAISFTGIISLQDDDIVSKDNQKYKQIFANDTNC